MPAKLTKAGELEINEVPDGYVVYQVDRDRVHYLNKTAAILFECCDGSHTDEQIVGIVVEAFGAGAADSPAIRDCLAELVKEGLVQSASAS